ncbi:MAG TPA: hypothetical protein VFJ86_05935 [Usitatibacter sp.]|nr:hypothetical protein [Usitatibacter sp.]
MSNSRAGASSPEGGDGMDDVVVRLGRLEVDMAALKASSAHFATKGDIGELKGDIGELKGDIGELKALIASVETSVIKWVVGTGIAASALAFAAARLGH